MMMTTEGNHLRVVLKTRRDGSRSEAIRGLYQTLLDSPTLGVADVTAMVEVLEVNGLLGEAEELGEVVDALDPS